MNEATLINLEPQTLAEYNSYVKLASEIMTGKEFRRKRRKKVKKTTVKIW
jgi:hypothetical protein